MSIDDHIATVNHLIKRYDRVADTNPAVPGLISKLKTLSDFLAEQKRLATPIPRTLGDVSDLPPELIRELSLPKTDELEDQILVVMRACEGDAGLDQVLVGLYRKFGVAQTRRFIQNKLYRMSKKELVYQVAGERAVYSLEPQFGSGAPTSPNGGYDIVASKPPHQRSSRDDLDDDIPF